VATVSRDKTLRIWDLDTLSCLHVQTDPQKGEIGALQVLSDNRLVFSTDSQILRVLDTETYALQESIVLPSASSEDEPRDYAPDITLLPDGNWICSTERGFYTVEDTKGAEIRARNRCKAFKEDLMAAAWNPARSGGTWLVMEEAGWD
jgi:WD40 repeat protein